MGIFSLTAEVQMIINDMKQYFPFLHDSDMIVNTSLCTIFVSPNNYSKIMRDINVKLSYTVHTQGSYHQNKMTMMTNAGPYYISMDRGMSDYRIDGNDILKDMCEV